MQAPAARVRLATVGDLARLAEVELRAAARFGEVGMVEVERLPPVAPELMARQQALGLVWVAGHPPLAFAVALDFPGALHLHEVDVVPEAAGRGLGRALIDAVSVEAARRGLGEVTLVTFRDVPWNAPYYGRLGFRESPGAARRPEIAALLEEERRSGLSALGVRAVMARAVAPLP